MIHIYCNEQELPDEIKEIDWSKDDFDYVVVPDNDADSGKAYDAACRLAISHVDDHTTKNGQEFFVTYHA